VSTELVRFFALFCSAAGLISSAIVLATVRRPLLALSVAVDFWVAAGLLRLSGRLSWEVIAGAAGIMLLRQLINFGLRVRVRTAASSPT